MKQGYLIAKNGLITEFFTSTSAYDRPQWKKLSEATVYPTAELADRAVKKLIKNGQYQVRIVSEMNLDISPIEPMGDRPRGSSDEELPPEDGNDLDGVDMTGDDLDDEKDPDSDDSEMKAGETGEVCPDCEHSPCTCEDKPDDEDLDGGLDSTDGEDEFDELDGEDDIDSDADISDEEIDRLLAGEDEQEADPSFDGRRLGMAQLSPMGGPRMESVTLPVRPTGDAAPSENKATAATMKTRIDTLKFKDPATSNNEETNFPDGETDKVRVPANVMSDLNKVIADFDKQAEFSKSSDEARASFCMTVADACRTLAAEISKGTVDGMKMANIKLSSYMSPITQHIPPTVVKFVYSGGAKPTLKDIFNAKREERK